MGDNKFIVKIATIYIDIDNEIINTVLVLFQIAIHRIIDIWFGAYNYLIIYNYNDEIKITNLSTFIEICNILNKILTLV